MNATQSILSDLQTYTETLVTEHNIPAASIAVWKDGQLQQAAAGILNLNTGVTATPDAIFQIGSITKVMTTCLVMQLVDEGRIALDTPVKHYLRDFLVADPEATAQITVRQLLNHTSGMAGDYFPDDRGHQGNLIARYVDRCNLLPQVHPLGEQYSYSNSAFVVAGRLVEVMRGISWYQAMQDYIFTPLGMHHALADPAEVIRHRAAMGHIRDEGADTWSLSNQPWLALGMAPCGSTPMMSAADLLIFARAHLDKGLNSQGERWLSADAVAAMQTPEIALPQLSQCFSRQAGLGWAMHSYADKGIRAMGHGGATKGFYAMTKLLPEHNAAFAILLNGVCPATLRSANDALLHALCGIEIQEPEIEKTSSLSPVHKAIAGHYESFDKIIRVREEGGQLQAHLIYKIDPLPAEDLMLYPVTDRCYAAENTQGVRQPNWAFVGEGTTPDYLFDGSRLNPRVA